MTIDFGKFLADVRSSVRHFTAKSPSTRDPRLIYYYLRRFGLIKTLGFGIYDGEFFAGHVELKEAYRELADVIYSVFRPESVCDFGHVNNEMESQSAGLPALHDE